MESVGYIAKRERVCVCLITSRGNSCSEYGPKKGGGVLTSRQTPPKGRDGDAVVECLPGPRA